MGEGGQSDIELERRLTRMESYIENHNLHDRLHSLERWRYVVLGAAILIGSVFTLFAEEIKLMVIR